MNSRHYIRHSALLTVCAAALCVALAPGDARAQSFKDALGMAYTTNPTIDAARAELRGVDELVPQARGGYLPTITGNAYGGLSHQEQDPGASDSLNPYGASITAQQPLYRGGKTVASINQAKETVQSQRGVLFDTEQQVLLSAATAFFNVVRDQAVVDLTRNNENVLSKQLEASQDRFRVGEVTRTDVSQSESRHSRAISDRIAAEGNLEVSRSNFARIVGQMPEKLEQPDLSVELPGTLDEAVAIALDNNPTVRAARAGEKAANYGIDSEFADLLPRVTLQAEASKNYEPSVFTDETNEAALTATLTIPLYQAGVASSQVRRAKQSAAQSRREVDEAIRFATDQTVQAWESLKSTRAQIVSRKSEVSSAEVALEGVRQEALVGSRTTLDVLDAEQELLDAKVSLVTAVRNENAATMQLLAAIGQLSPSGLGLDVEEYDPEENYDRVNNKLWGVSID